MYTPNLLFLQRYASILVEFALNGGKGLLPGETVLLCGNESTKPLYWEVYRAIIKAGGNVIFNYLPDEADRYGENRILFELGNEEQLAFSPTKYYAGQIAQCDHVLFILSQANVHLLKGIDSSKIMTVKKGIAPFRKILTDKEAQGQMSWTLCLYGTESMAKEAGLTLEEYWQQIIHACYLDDENPVERWRQLQEEMNIVKKTLSDMPIDRLHIEGKDADLWIKLGEQRQWLAGSGRNIPSFEVFVSPDWRGTRGWIEVNQPLYYTGKRISGIRLEFGEDGTITKATAKENEEALLAMIAEPNANKLGEYSLTHKYHSRITKFMAVTLYDENMGGEQGNTHVAVGNSYRDSYAGGNVADVNEEEWKRLGFNKCDTVHVDMVSTEERTVTAHMINGSELVIYKDGQFTFL